MAAIDGATLPFPLTEVTLPLAGQEWRLTVVQDQDALMRQVHTDHDLAHFPYGLMLWASAIGLARRLADCPQIVRGRRVLELGAGVGFAGLVAAHLGASEVIQTDYQADTLALARYNAHQNGVAARQRPGDWRDFPADLSGFDVVIGSDVLYERALHADLYQLFPRVVAPGGTLLLSDPLRPQALTFIEQLEATGQWSVAMDGATELWDGQRKDIAFFTLHRAAGSPAGPQ